MIQQDVRTRVGIRLALGMLVVVGSAVMAAVFFFSRQPQRIPAGYPEAQASQDLAMLAQANGMVLVGKDEIVAIGGRLASGTEPSFSIRNQSGREIRLAAADGQHGATQVFFGSDTDPPLVSPDIPRINVATNQQIATDRVDRDILDGLNSSPDATQPVIVRFKAKRVGKKTERSRTKDEQLVLEEKVKAHAAGTKSKIKRSLGIIGAFSMDVDRIGLQRLADDSDVEKISVDGRVSIALETSVDQIRTREAWPRPSTGSNTPTMGQGMKIAIIDTGVDYTRPEFGSCSAPLSAACTKVVYGYDFVNGGVDPQDDHGHGTHVAATAAGNGDVQGVAPQAKLFIYKALASDGYGSESNVIAAILRATDPNGDGIFSDRADVINMSLGGGGDPDDDTSLAVDQATSRGSTVVVAAGNSGPAASTILSPGTARTAITVAASCEPGSTSNYCTSGPIASFSSRGPLIWNGSNLNKPDISAPGVDICARRATGMLPSAMSCGLGRVLLSGTSMATPHVAGLAALIRQKNPGYSPAQVKNQLRVTARSLGVSADDQGQGEVVAPTAVGGTMAMTAAPSRWQPSSDPTMAVSTRLQTFSLAGVNGATGLTAQPVLNVSGITLTVGSMTGSSTVSMPVTVQVDNAVAKAGTYHGWIEIRRSATFYGAVLVDVTVQPTVTVEPAEDVMDYGVDSPTLPAWTSAIKQLTLHNQRTDVSQTVSMQTGAVPTGATYNLPSSVTLSPGETRVLDTVITADNAVVQNGVYSIPVTISTATISLPTSAKFIKYFVVDVTIDDYSKLTWSMTVHDLVNVFAGRPSRQKQFYFNTAGPYEVEVAYLDQTCETQAACDHFWSMVEDQWSNNGVATIHISKSSTSYLVSIEGEQDDGSFKHDGQLNIYHEYYYNGTKYPNVSSLIMILPHYPTANLWFSRLSTDHRLTMSLTNTGPPAPTEDWYVYYAATRGIFSNNLFRIARSSMIQTIFDSRVPMADPIRPMVYNCVAPSWCSGQGFGSTWPTSKAQRVWSNAPVDDGLWLFLLTDNQLSSCGSCTNLYMSPYIAPLNGTRTYDYSASDVRKFPDLESNIHYTGLGPLYWAGLLDNTSNPPWMTLRTSANYSLATYLRSQDFDMHGYAAIPYTIKRNGLVLRTGQIPAVDLQSTWELTPDYINPYDLGQFTFFAEFDYYISGPTQYRGTYSGSFTNNGTITDLNPPTLTKLYFRSNGQRSQVYDPAKTNTIELSFDAVIGSISSVQAQLLQPAPAVVLNVVPVNNGYKVTLPTGLTGSKIEFSITATDNSGNQSIWTEEMPIGSWVFNPVTVTAPSVDAVLSGNVTLRANVTETIGVSRMEFFLDSGFTLGIGSRGACAGNVCEYSAAWQSTAVRDGVHRITAVVTDSSDHTSVSDPVTVSIKNGTRSGSGGSPRIIPAE